MLLPEHPRNDTLLHAHQCAISYAAAETRAVMVSPLQAATQRDRGSRHKGRQSFASLSSILREAMACSPPLGYESGYTAPHQASRWVLNVTAPSSAAVLLPRALGCRWAQCEASRHPCCHSGPGTHTTIDQRAQRAIDCLTTMYILSIPRVHLSQIHKLKGD